NVSLQPFRLKPQVSAALGNRVHANAASPQVQRAPDQLNFFTHPQFVTSNRGGRRYLPFAFTEQGVAMLSSVLRSDKAVHVNIEIMRAFVRLRRLLSSHAELASKLAALEKKYDAQFKGVFDAIRELMRPMEKDRRPIGFGPWGRSGSVPDF